MKQIITLPNITLPLAQLISVRNRPEKKHSIEKKINAARTIGADSLAKLRRRLIWASKSEINNWFEFQIPSVSSELAISCENLASLAQNNVEHAVG